MEGKGTYRWTTKNGATWTLTKEKDQDPYSEYIMFEVGPDCPYYDQGYRYAEMYRNGHEVIFFGPGNEPYAFQGGHGGEHGGDQKDGGYCEEECMYQMETIRFTS
jgi:hypothetical protein